MRIIGGRSRGRKIEQPVSADVRPTKDRIREAVFNMIAGNVPDAVVMDIFAGSGAYGLEALSRGGRKAIFVDNNSLCVSTIQANINALGYGADTEVFNSDAFDAIESMAGDNRRADIVFLDPPYNKGMAKKALIIINHYDILSHSGLVVVEHHRDECVPTADQGIYIFKQKSYKDTIISIYLKK